MENLKLACLYSYGCTMVETQNAQRLLFDFIKGKDVSKGDVIQVIQKLQSYSAYRAIAIFGNRRQILEETTIRAYWLGDKNPKSKKLRELNHNFATLEKIKVLNRLIDLRCAISFGTVIKKNSDRIEVIETRLRYKSKRIVFRDKRESVNKGFLDTRNIKKGDIISIHLGSAREKISQNQAETLRDITLEALKILQKA